MGLGEWLGVSPKGEAPRTSQALDVDAITVKDSEFENGDDKPLSPRYLPFSKKELLLLGYTLFLSIVWVDNANWLGGYLLALPMFLMVIYGWLLTWPSSLGRWDISERQQIRSVLLIKVSVISAIFQLPFWSFFVADHFWFDFLPFPLVRTLFIMYVTWINTFDRNAGKTGARYFPDIRRRKFWKHLAAYFPIRLTRTKKLDPERNYVFGYHPHGIIGTGAITNFATFATEFDKQFPGIDLRVLTLSINMKVPFYRELLLALGCNDASKESIQANCSAPGRSVMLVVGGAAEALMTEPAENKILLGERKGFIKMALRTGSDLVPVYSFGENNIYDTLTLVGKWRQAQMWLQKKLGFSMPIFFGRALTGGILHRWFGVKAGIMPFRTPIHSVVGSPIEVPSGDKKLTEAEITDEVVDKYHKLYMEGLKKVYDDWLPKFEEEKKARLTELEKDQERREMLRDARFQSLRKEEGKMEIK